jgi:hypothetical protein
LAFLVNLWDEGGGSPWQRFYRGAKGWIASQREVVGRLAHVGKAPLLFPKVVVVEVNERVVEEKREKEGGDGRPATHFGRSAKLWPQFSSTLHHPAHLDPVMLKSLTKSIKSKANSFHLFPKFFLFLFEIFRFYHVQ